VQQQNVVRFPVQEQKKAEPKMAQEYDTRQSTELGSSVRSPLRLVAYGILFFYAFGLLFTAVALTLWFAADVLLLVFASILLAVFLRGCSKRLSDMLNLPVGLSLLLVVTALFLILALLGNLLAPRLIAQGWQLYEAVPVSLERVYLYLLRYDWFLNLVQMLPPLRDMVPELSKLLTQAQAVFSGVLNLTTQLALVLFLGLYLAAQPGVYLRGLLTLFPDHKKPRMQAVLDELEHTLTMWLLGKLVGMVIIGTATGMALGMIGVPLAGALGLITGVLNFIPYLGPLLGAIPTLLIAFSTEPMLALYAMLFYVGLQLAESYILTPFVDRRTVSLPPALTITVQVMMGIFFGLLGVMLATPLAAVAYVLINMLYVEDVLCGETRASQASET
jgi:predicted PurR-regulated permease PerM